MPGAAADQVAVDDAGLVDEDAAEGRHVQRAFGHGGHFASALERARGRHDLHAVAGHGHRLVFLEEVARDAHQVLVVAQILRRAAAREEEAGILLGLHVAEGDIGLDVIRGLFARDVPGYVGVGRHFVGDAVIQARLGAGDDDLEAVLGEAEEGVKRVHHFGAVADGHQDFGSGVGHAGGLRILGIGLRRRGARAGVEQRQRRRRRGELQELASIGRSHDEFFPGRSDSAKRLIEFIAFVSVGQLACCPAISVESRERRLWPKSNRSASALPRPKRLCACWRSMKRRGAPGVRVFYTTPVAPPCGLTKFRMT